MKILVINCGSSSLKYQLIDMDGEKVLCKGNCERIGIPGGLITHKTADGFEIKVDCTFANHTEAFAKLISMPDTRLLRHRRSPPFFSVFIVPPFGGAVNACKLQKTTVFLPCSS